MNVKRFNRVSNAGQFPRGGTLAGTASMGVLPALLAGRT